ncbi:unnamed protein product [Orchesella dallaii]|uniref:Sodium-dependent multivitamin transporter n=1 Tax=Orchesella dallaii TaxID=48710 RepID=A0ABP1QZJ1_9HEXA
MGDFAQTTTYKILSIMYAIIIVVLAFYAEHLGSIFQAAITVVTTAVSIQGSVFLMGVFMAFVNKIGAVVGMITGIILMGFLSVNSFILQKKYSFQPKLEFSTANCTQDVWDSFNSTTVKNSTLLPASELEFPEKIFTVSYILYPLIGCIITISTAVIISLLTGGRKSAHLVKPEYLHSLVRPKKMMDLEGSKNNNAEKVNMGFTPDDSEAPEIEECKM